MARALKKVEPPAEEDFRTPLGRMLLAAREEFLGSGEPMLDWEDLERELVERRGLKNGAD